MTRRLRSFLFILGTLSAAACYQHHTLGEQEEPLVEEGAPIFGSDAGSGEVRLDAFEEEVDVGADGVVEADADDSLAELLGCDEPSLDVEELCEELEASEGDEPGFPSGPEDPFLDDGSETGAGPLGAGDGPFGIDCSGEQDLLAQFLCAFDDGGDDGGGPFGGDGDGGDPFGGFIGGGNDGGDDNGADDGGGPFGGFIGGGNEDGEEGDGEDDGDTGGWPFGDFIGGGNDGDGEDDEGTDGEDEGDTGGWPFGDLIGGGNDGNDQGDEGEGDGDDEGTD